MKWGFHVHPSRLWLCDTFKKVVIQLGFHWSWGDMEVSPHYGGQVGGPSPYREFGADQCLAEAVLFELCESMRESLFSAWN